MTFLSVLPILNPSFVIVRNRKKMSLEERLQRIRLYQSSKEEHQRQQAVVLHAVDQTLNEESAERSASTYCLALIPLLSQNKGQAFLTTVCHLLDVVLGFTPKQLLSASYATIAPSLAKILALEDANGPLLRASIGCIESSLIALDYPSWSSPSPHSPKRFMSSLLTFGIDSRPKIRKRAQEALHQILSNPPASPALQHPATLVCAEVSLHQLQELSGQRKAHYSPNVVYSLQVVRAIASANGWPVQKVDSLFSTVLPLCRSDETFLITAAFEVFEFVFDDAVNALNDTKLINILNTLLALKPSINDVTLLSQWLAAITRGYGALSELNQEVAFRRLPDLVKTVFVYFETNSHEVHYANSQCLGSLLSTCIPDTYPIKPSAEGDGLVSQIASTILQGLGTRYRAALPEACDVIIAAFDQLRYRSSPLLPCLSSISHLRASDTFEHREKADQVIGAVVRAVGPQVVLDILPLNLEREKPSDPGRAWLLPILRTNISNTDLQHFFSFFVPLSERIHENVLSNHKREMNMETKIWTTLFEQIWALFPGYCNLPLDLSAAFTPHSAERLANRLYKLVDLRTTICRGLRNLVDSNYAIIHTESDETSCLLGRVSRKEAIANVSLLSSMSGKICTVLFNVLSQTLQQFRDPVSNCVLSFLRIMADEDLARLVDNVLGLLQDCLKEPAPDVPQKNDSLPLTSHTLMEIITSMVEFLPFDSARQLYDLTLTLITSSTDAQVQKRAYRILTRLINSKNAKILTEENSVGFKDAVIGCSDSILAPARRERLLLLTSMGTLLANEELYFIPSVLSEVVIATKEINEKARNAAYDLLVGFGERMKAGGIVINSKVPNMDDSAPNVDAGLNEYLIMLSAGLAGNAPHMISATIMALARITYQFKDGLRSEVLSDLVSTMDLFLTSNNREVVKSTLGFIKIAVISLPAELMTPKVPSLVENLLKWSHEHKEHFKAKVKHIFERLIRRFGYTLVEKSFPEADKKLIVNIRKTRDRAKRKKEEMRAQPQTKRSSRNASSEFDNILDSDSDSVSESAEEAPRPQNRKKRPVREETYIRQDDEDPMDLLDENAASMIHTMKPRNRKERRGTDALPTDMDGRMIIEEDMDMEPSHVNDHVPTDDAVGAYVDAIRSKDTLRRSRGNKVRYDNRRTLEEGRVVKKTPKNNKKHKR